MLPLPNSGRDNHGQGVLEFGHLILGQDFRQWSYKWFPEMRKENDLEWQLVAFFSSLLGDMTL